MKNFKKYLSYILLATIFILAFIFWFSILNQNRSSQYLKVSFLDVGQGDSIYIEAPNGKQILIDGGADAKVLSSLSSVMPFADRSIDIVIATHPDLDHIGGLSYVLDRYKVDLFIDNGQSSDSEVYENIKNKISKDNIKEISISNKKRIIIDPVKNIYLDIIFPINDIINKEETNEFSIVSRLIYGESSFLFMGDATKYTENLISWNEEDGYLKSDVLKLGHHGSKGSTSEFWLEKVEPEFAIISAGKGNRYGHPNQEVLDLLNKFEIEYLETSKEGNVIFETDGDNLMVKNN